MSTPKEFNDLIIKQSGDQIVRFKDIGRAELGPEDIRGILKERWRSDGRSCHDTTAWFQPY